MDSVITMRRQTLKTYCDWLVTPVTGQRRLPDCGDGAAHFSWYEVTYPLRTLIGASRLLGNESYAATAFRYMDVFVDEQLPQGGFTANFRGTPTARLDRTTHHDILRSGCVNLADNGSNVTCLVQAASLADAPRRQRYLDAAHRWFEDWVTLWALTEDPASGSTFWSGKYVAPDDRQPPLREGIYGNGIWFGHKINTPYTMAICNLATAFSAYYQLTGDQEYQRHAQACARFLCKQWMEDGRPINLSVYPIQRLEVITDYSRIFYLLEGLCWVHRIADDAEIKAMIQKRVQQWLFAPAGILSLWHGSWFNFNATAESPLAGYEPERMRESRLGIRLFWEMAKATGLLYLFSYYLSNMEDHADLRQKIELGLQFLSDPQRARMTGVMSDPQESYGRHAVQATGFAGLSFLEGIAPGSAFS
jgi:hypothetical protein